eukprot:Skav215885  [mRNA]  locus=scaffold956:112699:117502:- [translate_table: standard]
MVGLDTLVEHKPHLEGAALKLFRGHVERSGSKGLAVLVATDVAARGLDIPNISCALALPAKEICHRSPQLCGLASPWCPGAPGVIHYDLPRRIDDYVHRTGRTGRFGRRGVSVGFANGAQRNVSFDLAKPLAEANGPPPPWLLGTLELPGGLELQAPAEAATAHKTFAWAAAPGFKPPKNGEKRRSCEALPVTPMAAKNKGAVSDVHGTQVCGLDHGIIYTSGSIKNETYQSTWRLKVLVSEAVPLSPGVGFMRSCNQAAESLE